MTPTYTPRPFRESHGKETAEDIQRDIELMRRMYAERRSLNQPRGDRMVGFALLRTVFVAPFLAALIYHIIKR